MNKLNKILSTLVIGGVILSTSVAALATETNTSADTNNGKNRPLAAGKMMRGGDRHKGFSDKGIMKNNIEDNLKALVSSGVITQDEADKLLALSNQEAATRQAEMDKVKNMTETERKAYFEANKNQSREKKEDIFAKAVTNGIITQEKADAAESKLHETRTAEREANLNEGLSGLVTAGTISQEQSDKILAYVNTLKANKQAKGTEQTAGQKSEKKSPLSALVDDGTLTQAQLDEVSKVLPIGGGRGHGSDRSHGMNKADKASTDAASTTVTE
jgi:hypothetical protein